MTPIHVNEYDVQEHSTVRTSIVTDTVSIMIRTSTHALPSHTSSPCRRIYYT